MVLALFDAFMSKIKSNDKAHIAFCVSGIIGCLVCYGVLQVRWSSVQLEREQRAESRESCGDPERARPGIAARAHRYCHGR
jgi:hypothetical protein